MKRITQQCVLFSILILGASCNAKAQEIDVDISQIPMYGYVKKSKEMQKSDQDFIDFCKKTSGSLNRACAEHVEQGWYYLHQDDLKTAIRRFNQAWLLDSTNEVVYGSFATYLAIKGEDAEAKEMINKTIQKKPNSMKTWEMLYSFGIVTQRKTKNTLVFDYLKEKIKESRLKESDKNNILEKIENFNNTEVVIQNAP